MNNNLNPEKNEEIKNEIIEAVDELLDWSSSHGYIKCISDLTNNYLERVRQEAKEGVRSSPDYTAELFFDTNLLMQFVSKVEPLVTKLRGN